MNYLLDTTIQEKVNHLLYKEILGNNFVSQGADFYIGEETRNPLFSNTDVLVKKGYDSLLICVGESWTYGDSLFPYVKASENKDNLPYRIGHNFSGRLANYMKSDLLLTAVPGWSSYQIFLALEEILNNKKILNQYKNINIITQLSSPGRDYGEDLNYRPDIHGLFNNNHIKYNWEEWHTQHDILYLNWYEEMSSKFPQFNFILWRNFNEFNVKDFTPYSFKVVEDPCMRYLINLNGMEVTLAKNLEHSFFEGVDNIKTLDLTKEELLSYLEEIDFSFKKLAESELNEWHMNISGHWVWMVKLLNYIN